MGKNKGKNKQQSEKGLYAIFQKYIHIPSEFVPYVGLPSIWGSLLRNKIVHSAWLLL